MKKIDSNSTDTCTSMVIASLQHRSQNRVIEPPRPKGRGHGPSLLMKGMSKNLWSYLILLTWWSLFLHLRLLPPPSPLSQSFTFNFHLSCLHAFAGAKMSSLPLGCQSQSFLSTGQVHPLAPFTCGWWLTLGPKARLGGLLHWYRTQ